MDKKELFRHYAGLALQGILSSDACLGIVRRTCNETGTELRDGIAKYSCMMAKSLVDEVLKWEADI